MRFLLSLGQLLLMIPRIQSLAHRWPVWEVLPSPTISHNTSPSTLNLIHTLYDPIYNPLRSLRPSLLPEAQHHLQLSSSSNQDTLKNVGTIIMLSTAGHRVPLNFTLSAAICPLGSFTVDMMHELLSWMLATHPGPEFAFNTIDETIRSVVPARFGGKEYRTTLSLVLDFHETEGDEGTDDKPIGEGRLSEGEFLGLVKLVQRTVEALWMETGEEGFGNLRMWGKFQETVFEVSITWYEVVDGREKRCGKIGEINGETIHLF